VAKPPRVMCKQSQGGSWTQCGQKWQGALARTRTKAKARTRNDNKANGRARAGCTSDTQKTLNTQCPSGTTDTFKFHSGESLCGHGCFMKPRTDKIWQAAPETKVKCMYHCTFACVQIMACLVLMRSLPKL
jgi:hypothetical protein